jgi:hypothetical protein
VSDSPRIFVTYRREDSSASAGRLHDVLANAFGDDNVFQDVAAISPGEDFEKAVEAALTLSDVAIVVIGPNWLASGPDGEPRIRQPDDYVRMEISQAMAQGLRIIPVLVGGAVLPTGDNLPEELESLTRRQAVRLADETWREDANSLIFALRGETAPRARRWPVWAGVAAGVAVVALGVVMVLQLIGTEDDGSGEPVSCDPPTEPEWIRLFGPDGNAMASLEVEDGTFDFVVTDVHYRPVSDGNFDVVLATVMTNNTPIPESHGYWHYEALEVDQFPFRDYSCFFAFQSPIDEGQSSRGLVGFQTTEQPEDRLRLIVESGSSQGIVSLGISG